MSTIWVCPVKWLEVFGNGIGWTDLMPTALCGICGKTIRDGWGFFTTLRRTSKTRWIVIIVKLPHIAFWPSLIFLTSTLHSSTIAALDASISVLGHERDSSLLHPSPLGSLQYFPIRHPNWCPDFLVFCLCSLSPPLSKPHVADCPPWSKRPR